MVLREVDLIAAEDTRHTRKLLSHYDIHTRLTSYLSSTRPEREFSWSSWRPAKTRLVSDAGLGYRPAPGRGGAWKRIQSCACARSQPRITALVVSAAGRQFVCRFFTAAGKARRQKLLELRSQKGTLIFYEAPHRLLAALADLLEILGDRPAAAARELTKKHEEIVRGSLQDLLNRFQEQEPRGEFTLVVAGAPELQQQVSRCNRERGLGPRLGPAPASPCWGRRHGQRAIAGRPRGISRRGVYKAVLGKKRKKRRDITPPVNFCFSVFKHGQSALALEPSCHGNVGLRMRYKGRRLILFKIIFLNRHKSRDLFVVPGCLSSIE